MANIHSERIAALRQFMKKADVAAVIIPQADPHLSEYLASHWQARRWFSGFGGSAGDLVVTADDARLWTDSRYFLQAADQLKGSGIELMKDGLAETPAIADWLAATLRKGDTVGVDGLLFSAPALKNLGDTLAAKGIGLNCHFDVVSPLWNDRPALPDSKIYVHNIAYAGERAADKISRILDFAAANGAQSTFISALDEIAWTLNIRCDDVRHTPVATAYLYLSPTARILFIDGAKLTPETMAYLSGEGVATAPYPTAPKFLSELPADEKVLVEPAHTSGAVMDILGSKAVTVKFSPAARFKACKNNVQLEGIRNAMTRDGVALVHSFMEIERRLADGTPTTELDIAEILRRHRSAGENWRDESFGTIAGYGPHGAIVHYEADAESSSTLRPEGLLLVDSGAQYLDGTTDITRTVALGIPTAMEKADFTLVMKGHIALATMMFPDDTRGAQLDAIARQFLWRNGLSYLHGTGHGVGHFLGVHEGPQSIRLNYVDYPLQPGMITSDEPGLYRSGVHGIRCENLVLTHEVLRNEFGTFLAFETLTMFPFDRNLFDLDIMSADEIAWVDGYHATVRQRLTPFLDADAAAWLADRTRPLKD
ncbi:MAG: aminopeptidase P family protein [Muribaculaceae bacterium]|nr:aminopeptidase P family protein [Muribaculaceae bacterium]